MPDIAEAEVVPDGPLAVGSVITTARHQPGRTPQRFSFTVEECVPERQLTLSGSGGGHRSIVMYEIVPAPLGAEVRVAMTLAGSNPLASLVINMLKGLYQRQMGPLVELRTRALVTLAERLGEPVSQGSP